MQETKRPLPPPDDEGLPTGSDPQLQEFARALRSLRQRQSRHADELQLAADAMQVSHQQQLQIVSDLRRVRAEERAATEHMEGGFRAALRDRKSTRLNSSHT